MFEGRVFPEFISVSDLHVFIALLIVIIQSVQVDILVACEFVRYAVITPVNIAKKIYFEFSSKYSTLAFL